MTAENCISKLLSAPLGPEWSIEALAEQVLSAVALEPAEVDQVVVDAERLTDRQSRRLLRPLLACLTRKSAAAGATSPDLYEGRFAFERRGRDGPVWILGEFKNIPGRVRVTFRRSTFAPKNEEAIKDPAMFAAADARTNDFPPLRVSDHR